MIKRFNLLLLLLCLALLASCSSAVAQAPAESAAPLETIAPTESAALRVFGQGVSNERSFSLAELQELSDGYVEAEYYYRGQDPDRGHSPCQGLSLAYLLDEVMDLKEDAAKVILRASDSYAMSYTLAQVRKAYLDETDLSKQLPMILAWTVGNEEQDSLTLVLGQNIEGEYNRTFWVKDVVEIEVQQ